MKIPGKSDRPTAGKAYWEIVGEKALRKAIKKTAAEIRKAERKQMPTADQIDPLPIPTTNLTGAARISQNATPPSPGSQLGFETSDQRLDKVSEALLQQLETTKAGLSDLQKELPKFYPDLRVQHEELNGIHSFSFSRGEQNERSHRFHAQLSPPSVGGKLLPLDVTNTVQQTLGEYLLWPALSGNFELTVRLVSPVCLDVYCSNQNHLDLLVARLPGWRDEAAPF